MSEELKSCPACGRKPALIKLVIEDTAFCSNCHTYAHVTAWNILPRREEFYAELIELEDGDRQAMVLGTFKNLVLRREEARKAVRVTHPPIAVEDLTGTAIDGI